MSSKKVWFITGAGRGMGVDFAKAALAAGHSVLASDRDKDGVVKILGQFNDLLTVKLHAENTPFGITATIVSPGFFRTELLTEQSTNFATPSIHDHDERRAKQLEFWKGHNGKQSGDPAK